MVFINTEAINNSITELSNPVILVHTIGSSIDLTTDEETKKTIRKEVFAKIRYVSEKEKELTAEGFRVNVDVVLEFSTKEEISLGDQVIWNTDTYKIKKQIEPSYKGGDLIRNRFAAESKRK